MAQTEAIIFDFFGVICPDVVGNFYEKHKKQFGNSTEKLDALNTKVDMGIIKHVEFYRELEELCGIPAAKIRDRIEGARIIDWRLIKIIKKLKNTYKIGLISNAGEEEISILYKNKIDSLFESVVISHKHGITKPDSRLYLKCADKLDIAPSRCLYIDDNPANIKAAADLSMKTILYPKYGTIPQELMNLA